MTDDRHSIRVAKALSRNELGAVQVEEFLWVYFTGGGSMATLYLSG